MEAAFMVLAVMVFGAFYEISKTNQRLDRLEDEVSHNAACRPLDEKE